MTVKRQVLKVSEHNRPGSPVPEVIIAGDLLYTSLCGPTATNRETKAGSEGPDVDAQWLFRHLRRNVEAAGGAVDGIVELGIYLNLDDTDGKGSAAIRKEFLVLFPDLANRPACRVLNIFPEGTHWPMAGHAFAVLPGRSHSGAAQGRLLYSPTFNGRDPKTGRFSQDPVEQATVMFDSLVRWVEERGGTPDNIINITANLHADTFRFKFDVPWAKIWPDKEDLPARQTYIRPQALHAGEYYSASATAVI